MSGANPLPSIDSGLSGDPVTLDQLIALNDEMAALVRAGIPLEDGLSRTAAEIGGRTGSLARELGDRLARGERLPDALANSRFELPDLYRAIVEAGLRSGRLATVLEGMAIVTRGHAEARRAISLALIYPVIVLMLAYGLALGFILGVAPRFVAAFESLGLPPMGSLEAVARAGESAAYWGPIVPILLVILAFRWAWSGRAMALDSGPLGNGLGWLPWVGSMIDGFRNANFAELLALLIEHRVPLDESLRLSGNASGSGELRRSATFLSDRLRVGANVDPSSPASSDALPPLVAWMVMAGDRQGDLAPGLRHVAASYRRKAEARAELIRAALPTVLMLAIGAGTVLLYGLLLFIPMTNLYEGLTLPTH